MSTSLAALGRSDREILRESREKAERITAHVPESDVPNALERWSDWNEELLYRSTLGGNHGFQG